jgi:hypothetical protein
MTTNSSTSTPSGSFATPQLPLGSCASCHAFTDDPIARTPALCGPNANFLADSLGVSPLYRQQVCQIFLNKFIPFVKKAVFRIPNDGNKLRKSINLRAG